MSRIPDTRLVHGTSDVKHFISSVYKTEIVLLPSSRTMLSEIMISIVSKLCAIKLNTVVLMIKCTG